MNRKHLVLLLSACLSIGAATCLAEEPALTLTPATQPTGTAPATAPSAQAQTDLLGPEFSSDDYMLAFRPPKDSVEVHVSAPDSIVEFDNDKNQWLILARQVTLDRRTPLTAAKDQFGNAELGVLESTTRQFIQKSHGAEVISDDAGPRVINVGRIRVGELFARYINATQQRKLLLEAVVEVPDTGNKLYYFIDFIANAGPADAKPDEADATEKAAYDTFSQMIDSIKMMDRNKIVEDQHERLYHTRALFVNWSSDHGKPIIDVLLKDQWQRIIRDGKDIGYSVTNEWLQENVRGSDTQIKNQDDYVIHVDTRSRIYPVPGARWDTGTWTRVSTNRNDESWASVAQGTNGDGKLISDLLQIGSSHEHTKAVATTPNMPFANMTPQDVKADPFAQGTASLIDARTLNVNTTLNKSELDPFTQDVPVFYIPQGISSLLPRILPLNQAKSYMFGTFVPTPWSDVGKEKGGGRVMARYVDVLPARQIDFQGAKITVVPIADHVGISGVVTTHFMSPEGKFIFSSCTYDEGKDKDGVDKQTTLTIVSSNIEEVQRIWSHPEFSAPENAPNEPTHSSVVPPAIP